MKRIYTLLSLTIITIFVFSQDMVNELFLNEIITSQNIPNNNQISPIKTNRSYRISSTEINHAHLDSITSTDISGHGNKQLFEYDTNTNSETIIYISGSIKDKFERAFNSYGSMTSEISYNWIPLTSQWLPHYKAEDSYDSSGNITGSMSYQWNNTTSQWLANSKYEGSYDTSKNKYSSIGYQWNTTTSLWTPSIKDESIFNNSGNITSKISYNWNTTTSLWTIWNKTENSYDSSENQTSSISYQWQINLNLDTLSLKDESTFNTSGNIISKISYNWSSTTSLWIPSSKNEYSYDSYGNNTSWISYFWDNTLSLWVPSYKTEYSYNKAYFVKDLIGNWDRKRINILTKYDNYRYNNGSWNKTGTTIYHYSDLNLIPITNPIGNLNSINANTAINIEVYPNPTDGMITIVVNDENSINYTINISNTLGQNVYSLGIVKEKTNIDLTQLGNNGIYFIHMLNEKGIVQFSKKVLLQ